jgi:hypothetical protein
MREIVFNSKRLGISAEDSCVLPADDPIHEFRRTGNMDVFNRPKQISVLNQAEEHNKKLEMAKEMGIKPGTPAWNML